MAIRGRGRCLPLGQINNSKMPDPSIASEPGLWGWLKDNINIIGILGTALIGSLSAAVGWIASKHKHHDDRLIMLERAMEPNENTGAGYLKVMTNVTAQVLIKEVRNEIMGVLVAALAAQKELHEKSLTQIGENFHVLLKIAVARREEFKNEN